MEAPRERSNDGLKNEQGKAQESESTSSQSSRKNGPHHTSPLENDALEALAFFGGRLSKDFPEQPADANQESTSPLIILSPMNKSAGVAPSTSYVSVPAQPSEPTPTSKQRNTTKQELLLAEFENNPVPDLDALVAKLGVSRKTIRDFFSKRRRALCIEGRVPASRPSRGIIGISTRSKRSASLDIEEEEEEGGASTKRSRLSSAQYSSNGSDEANHNSPEDSAILSSASHMKQEHTSNEIVSVEEDAPILLDIAFKANAELEQRPSEFCATEHPTAPLLHGSLLQHPWQLPDSEALEQTPVAPLSRHSEEYAAFDEYPRAPKSSSISQQEAPEPSTYTYAQSSFLPNKQLVGKAFE